MLSALFFFAARSILILFSFAENAKLAYAYYNKHSAENFRGYIASEEIREQKSACRADKPPNGDFCRKLPFYLLFKPVNRNGRRGYRDKKKVGLSPGF